MLGKLKLYLLPIFLLSSIATIFIGVSRAADQTITCNSSGCSGPGTPLFNVANAAPGDSVEKTLEIKNDRSKDIAVTLSSAKESGGDDMLLDVLTVSIKNSDDSLISQTTLANFISGSPVSLGAVSANTTKTVKIDISFNESADNSYQNKTAKFTLFLNATGDDLEEKIVTAGAPFQFGGPPPPPDVKPASLGVIKVARQILGVTTILQEERIEEVLAEETETASCSGRYYPWWAPLIFQAFFSAFYLRRVKKGKEPLVKLALPLLGLALLSQLIHNRLGCNCAVSIWCERYGVFNLGILLFFLYFLLPKKLKKAYK
jgi:hypothetical protein